VFGKEQFNIQITQFFNAFTVSPDFLPSSTLVEHEVANFAQPLISTKQTRQFALAGKSGWLHSPGISMPLSRAASIIVCSGEQIIFLLLIFI